LNVDYRLCITLIIHQQLWGCKVEDKLYLGVREQKWLNTTGLEERNGSKGPNLDDDIDDGNGYKGVDIFEQEIFSQ
jgi:hypothetical protein